MDRPGLKAGLRCRSCEIQLANPETRSSSHLLFLPPGGFGGARRVAAADDLPGPVVVAGWAATEGRGDRRAV
jgi:hypothetical protein